MDGMAHYLLLLLERSASVATTTRQADARHMALFLGFRKHRPCLLSWAGLTNLRRLNKGQTPPPAARSSIGSSLLYVYLARLQMLHPSRPVVPSPIHQLADPTRPLLANAMRSPFFDRGSEPRSKPCRSQIHASALNASSYDSWRQPTSYIISLSIALHNCTWVFDREGRCSIYRVFYSIRRWPCM